MDGEALEEDMLSGLEDEMEQHADRVRTIPDQDSQARENVMSRSRHMRNTEAGALHVCEDEELR